jgi:hypothetical protein
MDHRDALLLVERLKRRTRDPDVLTLCEYVHGTDVHGTIPAFRRPGDETPPAVIPSASCPVCAARCTSGGRDGAEEKMAQWAPRLMLMSGLVGRRAAIREGARRHKAQSARHLPLLKAGAWRISAEYVSLMP